MATIVIDIPDADDYIRAVAAFCSRFGYQTLVDDGAGGFMANPETDDEFAKRMIAWWVKTVVVEAEVSSAGKVAREDADVIGQLLDIS